MSGEEVRKVIMSFGVPLVNIARAMGITGQGLNSLLLAKDVKSGTLEELARALGQSVLIFYPDARIDQRNEHGDNIVADRHGTVSGGADPRALMEILERHDRQVEAFQAQIDRLLGIVEQLSSGPS